MKLPRDITGAQLVTLLLKYEYQVVRQTASHIRLTSPKHNPLKIGTLSSILKDIAAYIDIDKKQLINELF